MNKRHFTDWLKSSSASGLTDYSVGRYANSIEKLSMELAEYGLDNMNLFSLKDPLFIDAILSNPAFQEKNKSGHRMYSSALKKLRDFITAVQIQEEVIKEEIHYEKYLRDAELEKGTLDIEDIPEPAADCRTVNNRKVWIRNPLYSKEALAYADYCCEIDRNHRHFTSRFNKRNYVEAHHLIPIACQDQFENSLDVHSNIVSLCLVCHKKIHFGLFEEKRELLENLFDRRKDRLKASGIAVSLDSLFQYYRT